MESGLSCKVSQVEVRWQSCKWILLMPISSNFHLTTGHSAKLKKNMLAEKDIWGNFIFHKRDNKNWCFKSENFEENLCYWKKFYKEGKRSPKLEGTSILWDLCGDPGGALSSPESYSMTLENAMLTCEDEWRGFDKVILLKVRPPWKWHCWGWGSDGPTLVCAPLSRSTVSQVWKIADHCWLPCSTVCSPARPPTCRATHPPWASVLNFSLSRSFPRQALLVASLSAASPVQAPWGLCQGTGWPPSAT